MVLFAYSLSALLMIFLPVVLAVLFRRRFRAPWILFIVGVLTFTASQLVHFPLNSWLEDLGLIQTGEEILINFKWQTAAILGLTAGLCEELARTAGFAILRRFRRFQDGIMMGLGHGGIESMVFGGVMTIASLSALIPLRGVDPSTLGLTSVQVNALLSQLQVFDSSPTTALVPLVERALAINAHLILSFMVWLAFRKRNGLFVLAAILYHAAFDSILVYIGLKTQNSWLIEGLFFLMLLPGTLWLILVWRKEAAAAPPHRSGAIGAELNLFITTLAKELHYQWRTKRFLVTLAVFGLFGLSSPMIAYFLPQVFQSIEGVEQFAALIPEPSVADAYTQYIKNLTQFGFILGVLLGMGAVVGEKERGTAPMILSKPLPRWAFILGKFGAQVVVYLVSFLVAALGGFYYTYYLFGSVSFADFMLVNFLLLMWLLPIAAATLFGSSIAPSTASAAGIGVVISAALLLAGYLPQVGTLAPSGLVGWASQIGVAQTVAPNGGALVMSLVLCILFVLGTLGVFELQEL